MNTQTEGSTTNAVEQVRELIRPGDVFDVESTYHDKMQRVRVGAVQKSAYECDVLAGEWAGNKGCRGSIPTRVGDVIQADAGLIVFKLRGPKGPERLEGHTVTLRRVRQVADELNAKGGR